MSQLAEHLTDALQSAVGLVLGGFRVRACGCDVESDSGQEVDCFYVSGELRLEFAGHPLYVSWVQGLYGKHDPSTAVEDDCCIATRSSSFYAPTAELVEWDLSQVEPWGALIGNRLESARVLSLAHFPNIIELRLGSSRLILANSGGREVGLGDDVLVSLRPDVIPRTAKELWAT